MEMPIRLHAVMEQSESTQRISKVHMNKIK